MGGGPALEACCSFDKDRDDAQVAVECGFELDPHHVFRIEQPPPAFAVRRGDPVGPNHRQHHVGLLECFFNHDPIVLAGHLTIDIEKEALFFECLAQVVEDPAGRVAAVLTSVRNEDRQVGYRLV